MIDLDRLCTELTETLPQNGWALRYPLSSLMLRHGTRCASASWNGPKGTGLALQLYQREKSPVLIVLETEYSTCMAEPYAYDAEAIVAALNEYRWVIK